MDWRSCLPALVALCSTQALISQFDDSAHASREKTTKKKKNYVTRAEVAKHNSSKTGVWVTYDGKAYDITEFIESHPGGKDKILLAAGGALEPLWRMYPLHTSTAKKDVQEILKAYYVGDLDPTEKVVEPVFDENDPWKNEPKRHQALVVRGNSPFNAETPLSLIPDNYTTDNELYYVRHHHPVPVVDPKTYRLEIKAPAAGETTFTLDDLKTKFEKHSVTMTMQCGGNRRGGLSSGGKTNGIQWSGGAISTATWSGARLSDVLRSMGVSRKEAGIQGMKHIQFIPLDPPYDASIPLHKALNEDGDVLLAYEMNGVEIPREHGYPIRVVVPGTIGARSVKWLKEIVIRSDEAESAWQRNVQYKSFGPNVKSFKGVDPSKAMSVQSMPVQSFICKPGPMDVVEVDEEDPTVEVSGYAWSGGGHKIIRVEVSGDGGQTWHEAVLGKGNDQEIDKAWAWTLWSAEVKVPKAENTTIVCRAVDSNCNQQPETVNAVWNLRGILNNSWHTVPVTLSD